MASMSYCVLENTSIDMRMCITKINGLIEDGANLDELGIYEKPAADRLYELCKEYIEAYEQAKEIEYND